MGLIGSLSKVTIPWFSTAELKISKICLSLLGLVLYPTLLYKNVELFQGNFSKSFKETVTIRILTPFNKIFIVFGQFIRGQIATQRIMGLQPSHLWIQGHKKGQIFRTRYLLLDT